jgi:hypothetical protein
MREHVDHIWLGLFGPDSPETYFVQTYVDDETPLSQFGAEQGERSFDYDLVEISFPNDPCRSVNSSTAIATPSRTSMPL